MGKESEKYICIYVCIYVYIHTRTRTHIYESLCCNPETNTTLQINYYFNKNTF